MCNLYTYRMTAEEMRALKLHVQFIGTPWTNGKNASAGKTSLSRRLEQDELLSYPRRPDRSAEGARWRDLFLAISRKSLKKAIVSRGVV